MFIYFFSNFEYIICPCSPNEQIDIFFTEQYDLRMISYTGTQKAFGTYLGQNTDYSILSQFPSIVLR
jgi:hypothetical protein